VQFIVERHLNVTDRRTDAILLHNRTSMKRTMKRCIVHCRVN